MTNKKLFLSEDKVGLYWVTWLAESRDVSLQNAKVLGSAELLGTARFEFLKNLEKAIYDGTVTVFTGNVTLIDPKEN